VDKWRAFEEKSGDLFTLLS